MEQPRHAVVSHRPAAGARRPSGAHSLRSEGHAAQTAQMKRRDFLRAGVACGASTLTSLLPRPGSASTPRVSFIVDPTDCTANAGPARIALERLRRTLADAGVGTRVLERLEQAAAGDQCVVCTDIAAPAAAANISAGAGPERLALLQTHHGGRNCLVVAGSDGSGMSYALLELADRIESGVPVSAALSATIQAVQGPANPVRSVMRQFTSDVLDKPWFDDREMWPAYLDMLASHRFNRLHLAFGLGYDSLQRVADSYFLFLYPFLVSVPGYDVRVTNLPDSERDRNLDTLRWIGEQTVARGLTFQLGIWMHGYTLADSPQAKHVVEGLTPATHAAYCRDALTALLRACPAISAVALRIHGESGIAEGSYDFWQTVFEGVPKAGRPIEIDLHSKGLDHTMIDRALATGMPVNVSPKYWAEHLGMPYHQAAIRDLEMPVEGHTGGGLMTLSEGSLSFTRYGYANFLGEDRRYTVRHRVFSGTQRLLLSADAGNTAAYSRAFGFCGSTGMDLMEPLTCRGRRGTGIAGQRRSGYRDARLDPKWDWQKYSAWYRTWGRLTFDPEAIDEARRVPGSDPGSAALASALSRASRILPIVTTAYLPSAACDAYWPEVYWNQPIVAEPRPNPYGDTPSPKTFQHASPLDPQLFATMAQCAGELISRRRSGRYTPLDAASWLEDLVAGIDRDLASAGAARSVEAERASIDVRMQASLGRFFAAKLRAGVLYAIHEQVGARSALDAALACYQTSRDAWSALAKTAVVYADDLSASDKISERGQWSDRLAAIDADIERMTARQATSQASGDPAADSAVAEALGHQARPPARATHQPPSSFRPGDPIPLRLKVDGAGEQTTVRCYYRHVNQAERFAAVDMTAAAGGYAETIPGTYTASAYPLQYYFVVNEGTREATLFPGLGPELRSQPYFVVRRA